MSASMDLPLRVRDPAGWQALCAAGVTRRLARGEVVAHDQRAAAVVLVESGALKVVGLAENDQTAVVAVRRGGEVGEFAAQGGRPRPANLVAIEPSAIVSVDATRLRSVLRRRPPTALALLQSAVARINEADRRRVEHVSHPMPERIRLVLRDLAQLFSPETAGGTGRPAVIPLAQQDVASLAGTTREATARVLGRLREEGTVETGRSRIVVLHPDRLG